MTRAILARMGKPISIPAQARTLDRSWDARDLVTANDSVLRLVRMEGAYDWHRHEEDQLFICWEGTFRVEMAEESPMELGTGDIAVVPSGVPHRIIAIGVAYALMSIGRHTVAPA
ncbi:MAG TPA: cupin domain-containing protein [Stellaceae bacterium]|nr:cupin domain-containing protein [Stellaceae bacterium]